MKKVLFCLTMCCAAVQSLAQAPASPPAAPSAPSAETATQAVKSDTFLLTSAVLSETRRINVFAPAGHGGKESAALPVLYMPDGGQAEDFPHVAQTVQALVAAGRMPPVLLVGIENAERRRDLTGPTTVESDKKIAARVGGSAAFRQFIRTELMPYIGAHYRVTADKGIVGESLAGLFIVETLLVEPDLFDRYVAISPSLWWNDEALVRAADASIKALPARPKKIFLTSADEDNIVPGTARLAASLLAHAPAGVSLSFKPMPNERHDTIYRASEAVALETVYGPAGGVGSAARSAAPAAARAPGVAQ
ncbi:alpha/beta hydrolase [Massilia aquatica]|uniref:Alpha/beta hydrolase n=1 Tax=Massilia aquatica TaxID=2609000 RepID=A0ABX0MGH8_9BURK|nr:alpha/beta hydrolase-fold protein [Massilia aquatica]NHZ43927.1 alpha/beta hydrolase [Massilia aquatica]